MKRVFSTKRFIEERIKEGVPKEEIMHSVYSWAIRLDGLTEEEIADLSYSTGDKWLVYKDDWKSILDESIKKAIDDYSREVNK